MFDGIPEHWKEEPWPANDDSNVPVPPIVVFLYIVIFCGRVAAHLLCGPCLCVGLVTPDPMKACNPL